MPTPPDPRPRHFGHRFFVPILAGATLRDRALACFGAVVGIALTAALTAPALGAGWSALIVAPMGASAVLVFAVPASPLAQPWPVIGGNVISALVGVAVARLVPDPVLAAALAVGLAIGAMSLTRSLHPPGGAAALTAVLGGPAVASAGFLFALVPVGVNAVVLVAAGVAFHRLAGRSYPHGAAAASPNPHGTADAPAQLRTGVREEDVDAALARLNESFDIDRGDILRLIGAVEQQALVRTHGTTHAADIMSRDVVMADLATSPDAALALLLGHNIRTLPVVDAEGRLAGTVGLRELAAGAATLGEVMSPARTAAPGEPAMSLIPHLVEEAAHAVVVVDAEHRVAGLITQTDLLAALARTLAVPPALAA
jgi:CBS domain-containing membrane protein